MLPIPTVRLCYFKPRSRPQFMEFFNSLTIKRKANSPIFEWIFYIFIKQSLSALGVTKLIQNYPTNPQKTNATQMHYY